MMRFDKHLVHKLWELVEDYHTLSPRFDERLKSALQIGSDITPDNKTGTRYIGMGGRNETQHGPTGARKAVAYLYGIGAASGALAELETRYPVGWNKFFTAVSKALADLGQEEFDAWAKLGRERAEKFRTD